MEQEQPERQQDDSQQAKPGLASRYRKWADRWGPRIAILLFATIFIAIALFNRIFVFIEPGEQGVLYRRIGIPTLSTGGTDLHNAYLEGMNVKMPYNDLVVYNVRAQQVHDEFNVLSSDGLTLKLEVSIRYRPRRDALPLLHVEVGPDYVETVVKPEVQANLRILMGGYTPDEIYTSQGYLIRRTVENAMPELLERHIILDDLLIKSITLPEAVQDSIESKLRQQQAFLEYEFRLQREEKERDRKLIEAEGIKLFQGTINEDGGSFNNFLEYMGIQATLALASSPNAKIVVIGNSGNGLPLILNMDDQNRNHINAQAAIAQTNNAAQGFNFKNTNPASTETTSLTNSLVKSQGFELIDQAKKRASEMFDQGINRVPLW